MWLGEYEVELPTITPRRGLLPAVGGWSPEADARAQPEVTFVAVPVQIAVAIVVAFVYPGPLFDVARDVGSALPNLQ